MIRPLRTLHRRTLTALGIVLPVALGLGLAARKPVPQMNAVPAGLQGTAPGGTTVWEQTDLFMKAPVKVRLLRDGGRFRVGCVAPDDFAKPDLLVYWSRSATQITDRLPEDAVLLGAFNSHALQLPDGAERAGGVLVLFSLADQEVVAVSMPIPFNASTP